MTSPANTSGWRESRLGLEIDLLYGKSLASQTREPGQVPVFGSNGLVGVHSVAAIRGPGIVVGRKGSVGAVVFSENDFWPIDTTYYVHNKGNHNWKFLYYLLSQSGLEKLNSHSAVPGLSRESVYPIPCYMPPADEQEKIAAILWKLQRAIATQDRLIATTRELKRAAMDRLFTHGMLGETLIETMIGRIPKSWLVARLDTCCDVVSSSMSYTDLALTAFYHGEDAISTHGIKVSDMNLKGNEVEIVTANLLRNVPLALARRKLVPPETVVFPKRGAAIATNKKRLTTKWTALDPNLIGVRPKRGLETQYLFFWFERFDLRTITESGPTPQLNKKNLTPLLVPLPGTESEQRDIGAALTTINNKLAHHQRKRAALNDLFQTLLHKLMTAEIRVHDLDIDTTEVAAPAA